MKVLFLISIVLMPGDSFAQDLNGYRWSNRLILVCGDTISESFKSQMDYFSQTMVKQELNDRKLIILANHKSCLNSDDFSVRLYGLDGGLKLSSVKSVKTDEIFDLINSMPMRKAEIRRKKG